MLLVGELCHCRRERAWLRQVRASYRSLFPALPEDSRFSRRAEQVRELLRGLRQAILCWADADLDPLRLLDSFPLPLCACYRLGQSSRPISGATFGRCDAKKQFFHGLRPQLLLTGAGFIEDLILAPGNCNDTPALAFYLDECVERGRELAGQFWVTDKGYSNPRLVQWAKEQLGLTLLIRQRERRGECPELLAADPGSGPETDRRGDRRADRMSGHRAPLGQDRSGDLPPHPSQGDGLLAGTLLQPRSGFGPDEHCPLRRLKLAKPVI